MKSIKFSAIFFGLFTIGYLYMMPVGAFHERATSGQYGNVQIFEWKYLLGNNCTGIHGRYWATMSLETFEKLPDSLYFDYQFTNGKVGKDKKTLSILMKSDGTAKMHFQNAGLGFDDCEELGSGYLDGIKVSSLDQLNGKNYGARWHNRVGSGSIFFIHPWNRSFTDFEVNEKFFEKLKQLQNK